MGRQQTYGCTIAERLVPHVSVEHQEHLRGERGGEE
jgi:hypothetical protein